MSESKQETVKKSKKSASNERFLPFLVVIIAVLSFAVGTLWQKVSDLESSNSRGTNTAGVPQAPQAAPSNLDDLDSLAEAAGVDLNKFNDCVENGNKADVVEADYQSGIKAGVTGTPGNFVLNTATGEVWRIPGAVPFEMLSGVIDAALGNGEAEDGIEKLTADQAADLEKPNADDRIIGNINAPIVLIEYSDLECPFCARFHATGKQMVDEYGNQVAWIYRHFPLDQIHPKARPAAIASECAAEIGGNEAFWKFTDAAFGL